MDLQYFFEKLFDILFCKRLALGSDLFRAEEIKGLNNKKTRKRNPESILNKEYFPN